MATNLALDPDLLEQAFQLSGESVIPPLLTQGPTDQ